ncbi:sensor histidine kinase [Actinoplanes subtropicus]|uniref:sensor histidine kinase n=1 Tax=Actinoplanes subtropicus TaxID=543632 RepID=UPI00068B9D82|nr:histidine kinase [Actinoplanes subtropicus]
MPAAGRRWLADASLAATLLTAQLAGMLVVGGPAARWVGRPYALAFMVVGYGVLALRRRYPLAVLTAQAVLVLAEAWSGHPLLSAPALLVAVVTVAAAGWRQAAAAGAVAATVLAGGPVLGRTVSADGLVTALGFCLAAVSTGLYVNAARGRRIAAQDRRVRAERERRLRSEAAVTHERLRIARELHDIVAHHLSLVVLQAAAARLALPANAPALPPVNAVESASRRALEEMRRMVGVLRLADTGVDTDRAPQPTLGELPELVEQARSAGLAVTLHMDADLQDVPDGVALCAYRIVQEALTNVIRHTDGVPATVTIGRRPSGLDLQIDNDGGFPQPGTTRGAGLGLVGMRERVSLLGGQLSAGPLPGGGWRVHVELPLRQAA